ncbi:MAG: tetratricopeptide repeat protein, partial [Nitrospirota bacterium]|nr:tetratricopeptide repeat protein [Nitrospirota bacterium]
VKKKAATTETEVKEKFFDIKDVFMQKRKTVFAYGILVLTVVLVIVAVLFYNYTSNKKSRELEYEAYKVYYNMYQNAALPEEEQFRKALELFQQAYDKKKSPRLLLYIASSYYELGEYDDALKVLNDFVKRYADKEDMLPLAYSKIAMIQIKTGNQEEALKTFDTMYKSNAVIYKDLALIESARILEKEGKKEEAEAKYRELTEKFPGSPFFQEAKSRLGEKKES